MVGFYSWLHFVPKKFYFKYFFKKSKEAKFLWSSTYLHPDNCCHLSSCAKVKMPAATAYFCFDTVFILSIYLIIISVRSFLQNLNQVIKLQHPTLVLVTAHLQKNIFFFFVLNIFLALFLLYVGCFFTLSLYSSQSISKSQIDYFHGSIMMRFLNPNVYHCNILRCQWQIHKRWKK